MANFLKVWLAGLVNGVSSIDHSELEQLDTNVSKTINGTDGSTHAPAAPITIAGAGLDPTLKATKWPNFAADGGGVRTRNLISPVGNPYKSNLFSVNSQGHLQSSGTAGYWDAILLTHDGATISSVTLYFKMQTGHVGMPAVLPKLSIARFDLTTGAAGVALNSGDVGGLVISPAVAVGPYENGGAIQSFVYACNQNNVVDRSKYVFAAALVDESGANSLAGNTYTGALVALGAISDMRFP